MPIYDATTDTLVTKHVQSALSRPDIIEIKNRTLSGKWHIQTIGTGATVVDVTAHFKMEEKLLFDQLKKTTGPIKVVFDGRYYTGVIDGEPEYERIPSSPTNDKPMFTITFLLLVETEGVV